MSQEKPDGGCLAWSIVAASSIVSFIQDGFLYSFGLLLPVLSTEFGVSKTEASLVHTLMSFMTLGSGPVVAEMTKRFGHRAVSVAGTLLAMAGLAAAGLYFFRANKPTIEMIYLFVGIFTGFGFGMMYTPAMDIIEHYFDRAIGIAAAGSGLGQFAIARSSCSYVRVSACRTLSSALLAWSPSPFPSCWSTGHHKTKELMRRVTMWSRVQLLRVGVGAI